MTLQEAMIELASMGTDQNRKVYARHGAGPNQFGVSFADLNKLKTTIRTDHALACELWRTGNADARNLAVMVADPARMSPKDLDEWVKGVNWYLHADLLARHLVSKSPHARKKADAWTKSKHEFVGQVGWDLVAMLAMNDRDPPDSYFEDRLAPIESGIHRAKNRVRHAMNGALIAIGLRNAKLRKLALAAAARIGKVEVDHGDTGCKTPYAADYIRHAVKHTRRK